MQYGIRATQWTCSDTCVILNCQVTGMPCPAFERVAGIRRSKSYSSKLNQQQQQQQQGKKKKKNDVFVYKT